MEAHSDGKRHLKSRAFSFARFFSELCAVEVGRCCPTVQELPSYLAMLRPDFKTWSATVKSLCLHACHNEGVSLFLQYLRHSAEFKPDHQVFALVLKSCAATLADKTGRWLHSYTAKLGHLSCKSVSKALLNMYAKCGYLDDCQNLFYQLDHDDPAVWNIFLSGYSLSRKYDREVIGLFRTMLGAGEAKPNSITVATVLPVCARLRDLDFGMSLHSYVIKSGLDDDSLTGNALVSMYSKCGQVHYDAFSVFYHIIDKDVISWNAIIAGFAENDCHYDAFKLFCLMKKEPIEPNYATVASILPVCASSMETTTAWNSGRAIHSYVVHRSELSADVSVCNALISFYLRLGKMKEAETLFGKMDTRDLISWNAIMSGYVSNGAWLKALAIFNELLYLNNVGPDSISIITVLPACAYLQNLSVGKEIHGYIFRHPILLEDTTVGNALVNFYAKCGELETAFKTFFMIPTRDLISWNTMLDACAMSRQQIQFLNLLHLMQEEEIRPDAVSILTISHFCATVLKVEKVKEIHCYSVKAGFLSDDQEPTIGNAILDAYSKCGDMECAHKVFQSLTGRRNLVTCNSLISGYVSSSAYNDAHSIFKTMSETDLTTWNLMVRVYAENDCPEQAVNLFRELQARGMKPDSVTIMSLLPVCSQLSSIYLLHQCYGYVVRFNFEDVHLKAALLDAYAKCGMIKCAYSLFHLSREKDLVSFTAMIGSFAVHGMGKDALVVFSHMLELGVKPDHVIFTSLLSACSHAGLTDEGLSVYDSMEKIHGVKPTMEHYACVVDLLARNGRINDAYSFLTQMPVEANANMWGALLGACNTYGEVELGRVVSNHLHKHEVNDIGNYVAISNLFAAYSLWDGVMEVRKLMRSRDMKIPAGCSWIELEGSTSVFVAGDSSHPHWTIIYDALGTLYLQMKRQVEL